MGDTARSKVMQQSNLSYQSKESSAPPKDQGNQRQESQADLKAKRDAFMFRFNSQKEYHDKVINEAGLFKALEPGHSDPYW